jgi:hypothetical protein
MISPVGERAVVRIVILEARDGEACIVRFTHPKRDVLPK